MLSLASAAYLHDKTLVSTYTANLETLPGADQYPKTMDWWRSQPVAWAACRQDPQPPDKAMPAYVAWLKGLPGRPVLVAYPAAFDFIFVYWYLIRFAGESPFSHSALDIKTYAMALLAKPYRESTEANMPARWFDQLPHTHLALDDAIEQGVLFCNMLAEGRARAVGDAAAHAVSGGSLTPPPAARRAPSNGTRSTRTVHCSVSQSDGNRCNRQRQSGPV
jgi:hypothetical protein